MRLGAVVCVLAACWSNAQQTIDNHPASTVALAMRDLTGAYWCSIASDGYTYDPFPCSIRKVDHRFVLAKLGGSQRFTGEVKPLDSGFSFSGEFYCPWGDCTQPMRGAFRPDPSGALVGKFREAKIIVTMVPAPDSAFGGVGYGGDGYGGFGGIGYGGTTYGAVLRNPTP